MLEQGSGRLRKPEKERGFEQETSATPAFEESQGRIGRSTFSWEVDRWWSPAEQREVPGEGSSEASTQERPIPASFGSAEPGRRGSRQEEQGHFAIAAASREVKIEACESEDECEDSAIPRGQL